MLYAVLILDSNIVLNTFGIRKRERKGAQRHHKLLEFVFLFFYLKTLNRKIRFSVKSESDPCETLGCYQMQQTLA